MFTASSKENKKAKGLLLEYVGSWKADKMYGSGTLKYANGRVYVGEMKNNKRHGQGILTYPDGGVRKGIWKSNRLIKRQ